MSFHLDDALIGGPLAQGGPYRQLKSRTYDKKSIVLKAPMDLLPELEFPWPLDRRIVIALPESQNRKYCIYTLSHTIRASRR